jgi:hypothetical protein
LSDVVGEDEVDGLVCVGEVEVLGEVVDGDGVVDGDVVVVVGVPVWVDVGLVVVGCVVVVVGVIVGVGWDRSTVVGLYVCCVGFNINCVQEPPPICAQIWAFCMSTFIGTMAVTSRLIGIFTSPIRLPCA